MTNAESTFHTDASFEDRVVDYVGLLCLNPAKSGGLSQLVSGYTVAEELATSDPGAFAILTQPFHVDRRGGVRPGESPTAEARARRAKTMAFSTDTSAPGSRSVMRRRASP